MLEFTGGSTLPALRLLVSHDDAEREFEYTDGAELARAQAEAHQYPPPAADLERHRRRWQDPLRRRADHHLVVRPGGLRPVERYAMRGSGPEFFTGC